MIYHIHVNICIISCTFRSIHVGFNISFEEVEDKKLYFRKINRISEIANVSR